jgi:hypothetical protein
MRSVFQRAFFRYGWDTRCRNWIPARILHPVLKDLARQSAPVLLDVGCGRIGVAAFLDGIPVVGVDLEQPEQPISHFTFQQETITDLSFGDRSFPVVSCIDVLEHLPLDVRERSLEELVRVTSHALLIACPHGTMGQSCDLEFQQMLEARGRPVPDWLLEHQRQDYPTSSEVAKKIRQLAAGSGRQVKISLSYCEPVNVCRFVRKAASRSNALYAAGNLLLGVLLPLMRAPNAENSYRMIMLAEFESESNARA